MQTGKGISIPSILKVGKGALTKIGSYLKNEGIEQAVIFFGNDRYVWNGCDEFIKAGGYQSLRIQ